MPRQNRDNDGDGLVSVDVSTPIMDIPVQYFYADSSSPFGTVELDVPDPTPRPRRPFVSVQMRERYEAIYGSAFVADLFGERSTKKTDDWYVPKKGGG